MCPLSHESYAETAVGSAPLCLHLHYGSGGSILLLDIAMPVCACRLLFPFELSLAYSPGCL